MVPQSFLHFCVVMKQPAFLDGSQSFLSEKLGRLECPICIPPLAGFPVTGSGKGRNEMLLFGPELNTAKKMTSTGTCQVFRARKFFSSEHSCEWDLWIRKHLWATGNNIIALVSFHPYFGLMLFLWSNLWLENKLTLSSIINSTLKTRKLQVQPKILSCSSFWIT